MTYRLFGIRHHGPGSARSLRSALEAMQPDIVLIEGPPEAEPVLMNAADPAMKPPVALLAYEPDTPANSTFFPFAEYSPEWQAIRFALANDTPVRFMDLPQAHMLALRTAATAKETTDEEPDDDGDEPANETTADDAPTLEHVRADPLNWLARAAGEEDGELWWERMVELRLDPAGVFEGIAEAMTALRAEFPRTEPPSRQRIEACREAFMRQTLRAAIKEGFENIAVVCGAWHVPALARLDGAGADAAQLRGLPKKKVAVTWVPWSFGRLASASGYGAGVTSPAWYEYLWRRLEMGPEAASTTTVAWLTEAARLLRAKDFSASPAHVVEMARLAETLAALRGRSFPSLAELTESLQAVVAFGETLPMTLVHRELIVGARLGEVPESVPAVPLEQDLRRLQKSLRLTRSEVESIQELDLRRDFDLARSHLFHRLALLGIDWGQLAYSEVRSRGTFRETWRLEWRPEFAVELIAASVWGNTVEAASGARAISLGGEAAHLAALTKLIDAAVLANLPAAIEHLMARLEALAAVAADVLELMAALPPLVRVARYGSVRTRDGRLVDGIVDGFVVRICAGLPAATASLDDEAAESLLKLTIDVDSAVQTIEVESHTQAWRDVLAQIVDKDGVHGLVAGRCARLLFDAGRLDEDGVARRMSLALSAGAEPQHGAAWVDGLLRGSGLVLLHTDRYWGVLDEWLSSMSADAFLAALPLLRRAFASFPPHERRQMGERAKSQSDGAGVAGEEEGIDTERAASVLPVLRRLLLGNARDE